MFSEFLVGLSAWTGFVPLARTVEVGAGGGASLAAYGLPDPGEMAAAAFLIGGIVLMAWRGRMFGVPEGPRR